MAILSHYDEEVAREGAVIIVDMFSRDPREEVHDEMSWRLLNPASEFGLDLQRFIAGEARANLSPETLFEIAVPFFWIVCETSIEEKHARLARFNHSKLGPVRCSLSNRLPLLERLVTQNKLPVVELIAAFEKARNFRDAAAAIGVDAFPRLLETKPNVGSNEFRECLIQAIYRVDLDHMFQSLKEPIKYDDNRKKKKIAATLKVLARSARTEVASLDDVLRTSMRDHFAASSMSSNVFSIKRKLISPVAVDTMITEPRTKMARVLDSKEEPLEATCDVDADMDQAANLDADRLYFQVTYLRPGPKKLNHAAIGAGGSVDQKHVAVRFLERVPGASGGISLLPTPVGSYQRRPEPICFLDTGFADVGAVVLDMMAYRVDTLDKQPHLCA
jgi:hypothetical protein